MLDQFIDDIPEAKREAYKQAIARAVIVENKDQVIGLFKSNPVFKSAYDTEISYKAAEIEKRYQEQKVPELVKAQLEEERKKGAKTPEMLEIEKLRAEREADQRELRLEKQRNKAANKAQELGLPIPLIEKFIGETDEDTEKGIEYLSGVLKPWMEENQKKLREELIPGQKPGAGTSSVIGNLAGSKAERTAAIAAKYNLTGA